MRSFLRAVCPVTALLLCLGVSRASADVKVDVKQDPATKIWQYSYTILDDEAVRASVPGAIGDISVTTRDLLGTEAPLMVLQPEGWYVYGRKNSRGVKKVVWGVVDAKYLLMPGGAPVNFVLYSMRSPGDATLELEDEGGHELLVTVQGPAGD